MPAQAPSPLTKWPARARRDAPEQIREANKIQRGTVEVAVGVAVAVAVGTGAGTAVGAGTGVGMGAGMDKGTGAGADVGAVAATTDDEQ